MEPDPVPIELKYKTKDEAPEDFREHLVEKDGAFIVSASPTKKVTEFRDKNVILLKSQDDLTAANTTYKALVGDDLEKFKAELVEMRDIRQQVTDGKITGTAKIEATVQERVTAAKGGFEAQIKALGDKFTASEGAKAQWKQKFERLSLHQQLTAVILANESGARSDALPDILASAEAQWRVQEDGSIVRMDGDTKIYGDNGDPMAPKEWLEKLLKAKPFFSKVSAGGGATGAVDGLPPGANTEAFLKLSPVARMQAARSQARR
jgi:hypothetical protein